MLSGYANYIECIVSISRMKPWKLNSCEGPSPSLHARLLQLFLVSQVPERNDWLWITSRNGPILRPKRRLNVFSYILICGEYTCRITSLFGTSCWEGTIHRGEVFLELSCRPAESMYDNRDMKWPWWFYDDDDDDGCSVGDQRPRRYLRVFPFKISSHSSAQSIKDEKKRTCVPHLCHVRTGGSFLQQTLTSLAWVKLPLLTNWVAKTPSKVPRLRLTLPFKLKS